MYSMRFTNFGNLHLIDYWLNNIFDFNGCFYARPYDSNLSQTSDGFELTSIITPVLQAKWLIKRASHLEFFIFFLLNNVNDVALVSLLLILNIFHILFQCFYYWLWTYIYFLSLAIHLFKRNWSCVTSPSKLSYKKSFFEKEIFENTQHMSFNINWYEVNFKSFKLFPNP